MEVDEQNAVRYMSVAAELHLTTKLSSWGGTAIFYSSSYERFASPWQQSCATEEGAEESTLRAVQELYAVIDQTGGHVCSRSASTDSHGKMIIDL
jgi:hypothetical protein